MPGTRSVYGNRLCRLQRSVGVVEDCTEHGCRFWEPGGAALDGRCAFETIDIERHPQLTARLRELRTQLESVPAAQHEHEAHAMLLRLLHQGRDE